MNQDRVIHSNTTIGRFNALPVAADKLLVPMSMKDSDDLPMSQPTQDRDDFRDKVDLTETQMDEVQRRKLLDLLGEYSDIFANSLKDKKITHLVQHHIDTGDSTPIKSRPYRVSPVKRELIGQLIQEMLEQDIIEPSMSPWWNPVVLIPKPDGSHRFCVDYRKLNAVTK